jgi:uncharacterized protein (UPF0548 family)
LWTFVDRDFPTIVESMRCPRRAAIFWSRPVCDARRVLLWRQPSATQLDDLARSVASERFTYEAVGATASAAWPSGYRHDQHWVDLGPAAHFDAAADALRNFQPQRGSGIAVGTDGPLREGTNVALAARLPVGFVVATARVVYVHEQPAQFAWAYGTLPRHPEEGEERFEVAVVDDRTVFRLAVFSRPHGWLSRSAGPIARRLQRQAMRRYLDAMASAV